MNRFAAGDGQGYRERKRQMTSQQKKYETQGVIIGNQYESAPTLLLGLKNGNRDAQAVFYAKYFEAVEALVIRIMGFDFEATDLVQDIFLKAIYAAPKFRGEPEVLKSWLFRIAINTIRTKMHQKKIHSWIRISKEDVLPETEAETAGADVVHNLNRAYKILEKMSATDRIVFLLRVVEKMTMEEIAQITNVSLSSAKRQFESARAKFMKRAQNDPLLAEYAEGNLS